MRGDATGASIPVGLADDPDLELVRTLMSIESGDYAAGLGHVDRAIQTLGDTRPVATLLRAVLRGFLKDDFSGAIEDLRRSVSDDDPAFRELIFAATDLAGLVAAQEWKGTRLPDSIERLADALIRWDDAPEHRPAFDSLKTPSVQRAIVALATALSAAEPLLVAGAAAQFLEAVAGSAWGNANPRGQRWVRGLQAAIAGKDATQIAPATAAVARAETPAEQLDAWDRFRVAVKEHAPTVLERLSRHIDVEANDYVPLTIEIVSGIVDARQAWIYQDEEGRRRELTAVRERFAAVEPPPALVAALGLTPDLARVPFLVVQAWACDQLGDSPEARRLLAEALDRMEKSPEALRSFGASIRDWSDAVDGLLADAARLVESIDPALKARWEAAAGALR